MSKELRYPSLRAVIQYLEPNIRLELSRRCPSLFHVEKAVPLCLNYLYLGPCAVCINNTMYSVSVIRHYPPGIKPLKQFKKENDQMWNRDLDKYGYTDCTTFMKILPGDIRLDDNKYRERTREDDDEEIGRLQRRLAHLNSLRRMKQREEEKDLIRSSLFLLELRKSDTLPPFTMYLKFDRSGSTTEYLDYNKKQYEACKYLFTRIFGGRKQPICVANLKIASVGGVLRLPPMKIRVRNLTMGTNVELRMNFLKDILVEDSKIWGIGIYHGSNIIDSYQLPLVKSVLGLLIYNISLTGDKFEAVLNDQHKYLKVFDGRITVDEYMLLIEKMIGDKRNVGTEYKFGVHSKSIVKALLNRIKEREKVNVQKRADRGCPRFPFSYSMPIGPRSQLVVFCKHATYQPKIEPWCLYICVERL